MREIFIEPHQVRSMLGALLTEAEISKLIETKRLEHGGLTFIVEGVCRLRPISAEEWARACSKGSA